jgi:hypothetical protein
MIIYIYKAYNFVAKFLIRKPNLALAGICDYGARDPRARCGDLACIDEEEVHIHFWDRLYHCPRYHCHPMTAVCDKCNKCWNACDPGFRYRQHCHSIGPFSWVCEAEVLD